MDLSSPAQFIGKQGKDIISFGSGQPDLPPPERILQAQKIRRDLRYGLIQGNVNLREALAREYPRSNADNFVVTNGASEALDLLFRSLPNGKVLLTKPYYYSYPPLLKAGSMIPTYVNTTNGHIDLDDFENKIQGCKAVLINSPSNPTGRVEKVKTLKEIEKITKDLGISVISDEVYKDLIYERDNYLIKGDHVLTVNSFSKTYNLCGLRIGYLWSKNTQLVNKCIELKTHSSMNTSLVGQDIALQVTKTPPTFITRQQNIWKKRRDIIYELLNDLGLSMDKPQGAFYVLPKVENAKKFVSDLYTKHKVITYLGDWFGAPGHVRFSYALSIDQIEQGISRIKRYLDS